MSIEAAKEIIARLDSQMGDRPLGNPLFSDPDVTGFPFSKQAFRRINPVKSDRLLAFVDGGNLELLGAPNFSVQLNRICSSLWKNNARYTKLKLPQVNFFSAIFSTIDDGKISYQTIIVPGDPAFSALLPDPMHLSFDSFDRTITNGNQRADTSKVASIARNFAEWKYAAAVSEYLCTDDILVMDGSLQTQFTNEWEYFRRLEQATQKREVILSSLSKTSTLFTDSGLSLLGSISQFAKNEGVEGEWVHPLFDSRKHHVFGLVVKLNDISDWVFRLDFQRDQFLKLSEETLNEILNLFCSNSSDPSFPGYPYGSIDVDLFSRVSQNELDYYRALVSSQISNLNKQNKYIPHIRAGDAHNLLNTIAGF
ncbi:MAG: hypothetical protein OK457_09770 [Thaumarchaeota archaeon]|nr:hypothetical protein [Nitrososphaerota archaeon]